MAVYINGLDARYCKGDGLRVGENQDVTLVNGNFEHIGGAAVRLASNTEFRGDSITIRNVHEGLVVEPSKMHELFSQYPALKGASRDDILVAAEALRKAERGQLGEVLESTALYRTFKDTSGIEWLTLAVDLVALFLPK